MNSFFIVAEEIRLEMKCKVVGSKNLLRFLRSPRLDLIRRWLRVRPRLFFFIRYFLLGSSGGDVVRYVAQRPKIVQLMEDISEDHIVLDVGCGVGLYSFEVFRRTKHVVCLDIQLKQLVALKQLELPIELILADAQCLPFKDLSFDALVCIEVLEHLEDDEAGLIECFRILKDGGIAIFSVPQVPTHLFFQQTLRLDSSASAPFGHKRIGYNKDQFNSKLCRNGFQPLLQTHCMYCFSQWALLYLAGRARLPAFVSSMICLLDFIVEPIDSKPYDLIVMTRKTRTHRSFWKRVPT